jgi:hypothetical protein
MSQSSDRHADGEPPSSPVSDDADGALVDRVMAIAHLPQTAHVAVIGHHTLPFVVALLTRPCGRRVGAPASAAGWSWKARPAPGAVPWPPCARAP